MTGIQANHPDSIYTGRGAVLRGWGHGVNAVFRWEGRELDVMTWMCFSFFLPHWKGYGLDDLDKGEILKKEKKKLPSECHQGWCCLAKKCFIVHQCCVLYLTSKQKWTFLILCWKKKQLFILQISHAGRQFIMVQSIYWQSCKKVGHKKNTKQIFLWQFWPFNRELGKICQWINLCQTLTLSHRASFLTCYQIFI